MIENKSNYGIKKNLDDLLNWVIKNHYFGWDVYDGLNNPRIWDIENYLLKMLILQANIYSPINLRPFLGIQKGLDLKAMCLFSQAYAFIYTTTGHEKSLNEMQKCIQFIKKNSLKKEYGYDCWSSHYFPYIGFDKTVLSSTIPDIIGTSHAIIALIKSHNITKNPIEKDIASSAVDYLIHDLYYSNNDLPFFKYTGFNKKPEHIVLNASAHAIEAFSAFLEIENSSILRSKCEEISHMLLKTQRKDGSWVYSINLDGSIKRIQLDFHQGYIIDGLLAYLPYSEDPERLQTCIQGASHYYQNKLFRQNGSSYYRYPIPYPIDIHNQAQGIITFSKLSKLDKKWLETAFKVAIWTIQNLQDKSGYFYHQKWLILNNKIPYIRWGQAWMALALATLLKNNNERNI